MQECIHRAQESEQPKERRGPIGQGKTKAKAKAKGKATAKNTAEPYAMFSTDAEFANCPSSESLFDDERGGTFMLGTPFKGVLEKASEFLEAFSKEFQCSDVRVMTGKAQKDVGVLQSELRPGGSFYGFWSECSTLDQSNHCAGMPCLACFPKTSV